MSGKGSRFKDYYPNIPKPLLKIKDKEMFQVAAESIKKNFINVKKISLCVSEKVNNKLSIKNKKKFNIANVKISKSPVDTIIKACKIMKVKSSDKIIVFDCDQTFELFQKIDVNKFFKINKFNSFVFYINDKNKEFGKLKFKKNIFVKSFKRNKNLKNSIVGVYGFNSLELFLTATKYTKNKNLKKEIVLSDILNSIKKIDTNKFTKCIKVKKHKSFGNIKLYNQAIN